MPRPAVMAKPWARKARLTVLLVLVIIAWLYLAPRQLGGPVSYVTTSGNSMSPLFRSGDLAVVREADHYEVGDIVAYRNPLLNVVFLHRIVERDGDRFVFKGDHNDFKDVPQVTKSRLIGKLWLRVGGGGDALAVIQTPRNAAIAMGLLALLAVGGIGRTGTNRRRSRPHRSQEMEEEAMEDKPPVIPAHEPPQDPTNWRQRVTRAPSYGSLALLGAGLVVFAVLAALSFSRPAMETSLSPAPYSQKGTFDYSGTARRGPVYPNGRVVTGDPVFVRLVKSVRLSFDYAFDSSAERSIGGRYSLAAEISDASGWKRDILLDPGSVFRGDTFTASGTLDLSRLRELTTDVQAQTGIVNQLYSVKIRPRVSVDGTLAGEPLQTTFSPALDLELTPFSLGFSSTTRTGTSPARSLRPEEGGSVDVPVRVAKTIHIASLRLDVAKARLAAVGGGGLCLVALLLLGLPLWAALRRDEPARIQARYGAWLIDVRSARLTGPQVEVRDVGSLVQLARRFDRPVLHEEGGDTHLYVVEGDVTTYSYRTRNGTGARDERATTAPPPPPPKAADAGGDGERYTPSRPMLRGDRE
jgi:signal peptidase I